MDKLPSRTVELIQELEKIYPDRMDIDDTHTDKERFRLEGKVELIRWLKTMTGDDTLKDK